MAITYLDSGVLIEAFHAEGVLAEKALRLLETEGIAFAASEWIRLEILGQPEFHGREVESGFYESYLNTARHWPPVRSLKQWTELALGEMKQYGLKPLDALHVVAASLCKAEVLVTTERRMKSLHRTKTVKVVSLADVT